MGYNIIHINSLVSSFVVCYILSVVSFDSAVIVNQEKEGEEE